jgi:pyruvate dehydrogenase E2 component (dihydrolipoamide acetyltransferase)
VKKEDSVYEFKLPDLGEGIHEAEILLWHVAAGDAIEEDQPLVDVETDKAAVTIPSPKGGTVTVLKGSAGDIVRVGDTLVVFELGGRDGDSSKSVLQKKARPDVPDRAAPVLPGTGPSFQQGPRPPAAPATRRLARELGVLLADVPPTGPAGRVTDDDVRRFAAAQPNTGEGLGPPGPPAPDRHESARPEPVNVASPAPGAAALTVPFFSPEPLPDLSRFGLVERVPLRSIRRRVARKMVTSMLLVPHVVHWDEADVTELEDFRRRYRERYPEQPRLTALCFVIKAVTAALREVPIFNASLDGEREEILLKKYINIGIAADTAQGLVVPVLRGPDQKSLSEVAHELQGLVERVREGQGSTEDFQGGTFTITNMGPLGGVPLAPAINYPEVAILGMGRIQEKPVIREGAVVARSLLPLTLAFDHRVADGADAARFVGRVVQLLSDPDRLLVEG